MSSVSLLELWALEEAGGIQASNEQATVSMFKSVPVKGPMCGQAEVTPP